MMDLHAAQSLQMWLREKGFTTATIEPYEIDASEEGGFAAIFGKGRMVTKYRVVVT